MGRKLDMLLHRKSFKTSKFKALVSLAIARLAVLKNQREVRCSQGRSDVAQLLRLGYQERALLRVEQLIKDQNMLDVYVMIEGCCHILTERLTLIENQKDCPHDLREAISSIIFAASRCGDFPELQEIRFVFTQRYGRDFAAAAVELRNSCGVNTKMIQKMSTKLPSYETRLKVVRGIGAEIGITVNVDEAPVGVAEPKVSNTVPSTTEGGARLGSSSSTMQEEEHSIKLNDLEGEEKLSGSFKAKKYRDVATAAQAAFESAAHAAAAARAAVELARPEYQHRGSGDQGSPSTGKRDERSPVQRSGKIEQTHILSPDQNFSYETEDEEDRTEEFIGEKVEEKGVAFDESDEDSEKEEETIRIRGSHFEYGQRSNLHEDPKNQYSPTLKDHNYRGRASLSSEKPRHFDSSSDGGSDENTSFKPQYRSKGEDPVRSPDNSVRSAYEGLDWKALRSNNEDTHVKYYAEEEYKMRTGRLNSDLPGGPNANTGKKPVSVRTRRGFGY
ncbi:uncharacterized protein [Aristolochia californica]|uniref:uncharacterized protein isoform X2 n=1 Tax=Aristolochia californica TaxID=171875 RepID=UPI0035D5D9BB